MSSIARIPTAPVPLDWMNTAPGAAHPVFQLGPPTDFPGQIIPNPDNIQPMSDTESPTRLIGGKFSTDNFHGKAPVKTVGDQTPPLPKGYTLDSDSTTPPLPAGYKLDSETSNQKPDQKVSLDKLANASNDIPLDSYTHATERGLANIGQGIYQVPDALMHP